MFHCNLCSLAWSSARFVGDSACLFLFFYQYEVGGNPCQVSCRNVLQWAVVRFMSTLVSHSLPLTISHSAVSYIGLSMSIGLVVDYVMHVLMRYYELKGTRQERTVEMLRTMGASVLVGGLSTFLGTMLLAFSSTRMFYTIFVTFLGIVTLGLGHGLILAPVILATIGPEDESTDQDATKADSMHPKSGFPRKHNIKFEI